MIEKLFANLEKFWKVLLVSSFALLLLCQTYHVLQGDSYQMQIAERLGAEVKTEMEEMWIAAVRDDDLFAYLTLEVVGGDGADALLRIDGAAVGTLEGGLLTVKVHQGEQLSVDNSGVSELTIEIGDYPESLDESALPSQLIASPGTNVWGNILFK